MHERYIFSINTGRAGSKYLANILDTSLECHAFHEDYPNFAGYPIKIVNTLGPKNTLNIQNVKITHILETNIEKKIYADTSHLFVKSWYYAALKYFENVTIIHLRRNKKDVIKSLIRLNTIPGMTVGGINWYLSPEYPYNLTKAPVLRNSVSICEWYIEEIEARAVLIKNNYPQIQFIEVQLECLNEIEYVKELFIQIGLTTTANTYKIVGLKLNEKTEEKLSFINKIFKNVYKEIIIMNPFRNRKRIHIEDDGFYW